MDELDIPEGNTAQPTGGERFDDTNIALHINDPKRAIEFWEELRISPSSINAFSKDNVTNLN